MDMSKNKRTSRRNIVKSNYLIPDMDVHGVSFFNRALVSEQEFLLTEEYDALDNYPLQIVTLLRPRSSSDPAPEPFPRL